MAASSDYRIAVVVRCHQVSDKLDDLIASLRGHDLFDLYVSANVTKGPLDLGPGPQVPYDLDVLRELGLSTDDEYMLVYCSDLLFEHYRRELPDYDFYILIEYDVELVRGKAAFMDALARRLRALGDVDLIGSFIRPMHPSWSHYANAARLYDQVHAVFFPFVGLSRRAIERLYERRVADEPRDMPTHERIFCEAFVASALIAQSFRVMDLVELFPDCYTRASCYWGLPMLFSDVTPLDRHVELKHPVYAADDFLKAQLTDAAVNGALAQFAAAVEDLDPLIDPELCEQFKARADAAAPQRPPFRDRCLVLREEDRNIAAVVLVEDEDLAVRAETGAVSAAVNT